jgi:hypothetical protein
MFPTDWMMLAEIDGDLISLIVFAVFIVGGSVLRALGNALTKRQKAPQEQQAVSRQDKEEDGDSVYEADQETVQRYLASLMGVKPPQQPKANATQRPSPGRPPQRGATLAQTHPSAPNREQPSRGVPQRGATLGETHAAGADPQQQSRLQPGAILLKTHAEKSLYVPPPQAPPAPPSPHKTRDTSGSSSDTTEEYQFGTAEPQSPPKRPARKAEHAPAATQAKPAPKRPVLVKEHGGRSARERIAFKNLSPLKRAIVLREVLDRRRGAHRFLNS